MEFIVPNTVPPHLTAEKKSEFLRLMATGLSVSASAAAVGRTRQSMYEAREKDPEFADAWQDALETGTDSLEDVAIARGKAKSDVLLLASLRARRPDKWSHPADGKRADANAPTDPVVEYRLPENGR